MEADKQSLPLRWRNEPGPPALSVQHVSLTRVDDVNILTFGQLVPPLPLALNAPSDIGVAPVARITMTTAALKRLANVLKQLDEGE